MTDRIIFLFLVFTLLVFGSCKEVSITGPPLPVESDNSLPAGFVNPANQQTVRLTVDDKTESVVYVNQPFMIKVSLYGMAFNDSRSLCSAVFELDLPHNVRVEKIIRNPNLFTPTDSIIELGFIDPVDRYRASYGITYIKGAVPSVPDNGVVLKLICRAQLSAAGSHTEIDDITRGNFSTINLKVLSKGSSLLPTTSRTDVNTFTFIPLRINVSDEFGGG